MDGINQSPPAENISQCFFNAESWSTVLTDKNIEKKILIFKTMIWFESHCYLGPRVFSFNDYAVWY